jgi:signal transduction histidine kinase/CheY-like chemotaxis protein
VAADVHRARGGADIDRLVAAEQLRLSVDQVRRIPLPHFFLDVCVAWTGWHVGLHRFAWTWLAGMTLAQVGRSVYAVRAYQRWQGPPAQLLNQLAVMLAALGAVHALFMAVLFTRPVTDSHYILTMIFVGNAAGAVSPAAGHVRSYLAWAAVFGGSLAVCWLSRGTLEGGAIALLVVFLFSILTLYVRDQGRTLAKLVELTESLRIERDRAEAASEAKTRFFAAASHDLRQPLTALSYNAATVQALAAASGEETLARVGDNLTRALRESRSLLDSLLEVSQLDANAVEVTWTTVDVSALVEEVRESFTPLAEERGLLLQFAPPPGVRFMATTDGALLRRIVQNLVGNALKFTVEGRVTLNIRMDGRARGALRIGVADTGPGIEPAYQERVFEEFFQVGNAERNRSRGLGLGLSIVRRLAALLEARVELVSTPGIGSLFEVVLPQGQLVEPEHVPVVRPSSHASPRPGVRVLLIDDEPDIREALRTLLTTRGWRVEVAQCTREALKVWDAGFVPEALIVDFRLLGGESGLDALQALRARGCQAPAWLITGDTAPDRIAAARAAGVPVIYKPVDGAELVVSVSAVLAG